MGKVRVMRVSGEIGDTGTVKEAVEDNMRAKEAEEERGKEGERVYGWWGLVQTHRRLQTR